jgi:TPR repeat protein
MKKIKLLAISLVAIMLLSAQVFADSEQEEFDLNEYRILAEEGCDLAQDWLGYFYVTGTHVERCFETAVYWWRLSANAGNFNAEFNLGTMYLDGLGVYEACLETAMYWLRRASLQDDSEAANF